MIQNVLNVAGLHCHKASASPRNLIWFTRLFLFVRVGSGNETRLTQACPNNVVTF